MDITDFDELYDKMEYALKNRVPGFQSRIFTQPRGFFDLKDPDEFLAKKRGWKRKLNQSFKPTGDRKKDMETLDRLLIKLVTEEDERKKSYNDHHIAKELRDEFRERISPS